MTRKAIPKPATQLRRLRNITRHKRHDSASRLFLFMLLTRMQNIKTEKEMFNSVSFPLSSVISESQEKLKIERTNHNAKRLHRMQPA